MSHRGSANRDQSSRRSENRERTGPSRSHSADRAETFVIFERAPGVQPPPRVYVQAPNDSAYAQPSPPFEYSRTTHFEEANKHPSRDDYRGSQRQSGRHTSYERDNSHGHVFYAAHDDSGRMPSIQQNYRPSQSRPEAFTTFVHLPDVHYATADTKPSRTSHQRHERVSRRRDESKILHEGGGGGGGGGDIQTSAVKDAEPIADTLNKITICVYRNSKRQFVQKEVWMTKAGHRDDVFSRRADLREDAAFHKVLRKDADFFEEINWRYRNQLRGRFRQYLSFKTVSTVRVLGYGNNRFGLADINEKVFSPVFMRAYNNPSQSLIDRKDNPDDPSLEFNSWVGWFWLKRRAFVLDKKVDLAIELVEAYDPDRVLGGIAIALFIYFALAITWLALGGDPNYVSGVMSFVLSILAVLVGLTGLYDWLDLGHMGGGKDFLVLNEYELKELDRDGWGGL